MIGPLAKHLEARARYEEEKASNSWGRVSVEAEERFTRTYFSLTLANASFLDGALLIKVDFVPGEVRGTCLFMLDFITEGRNDDALS